MKFFLASELRSTINIDAASDWGQPSNSHWLSFRGLGPSVKMRIWTHPKFSNMYQAVNEYKANDNDTIEASVAVGELVTRFLGGEE